MKKMRVRKSNAPFPWAVHYLLSAGCARCPDVGDVGTRATWIIMQVPSFDVTRSNYEPQNGLTWNVEENIRKQSVAQAK